MNSREFSGYSYRFLNKTGTDLWDAAQRFGLMNGFFFDTVDDLLELSRDDEESFISLVEIMERELIENSNQITDRRVTYAIAISLYNTRMETKRKKIEESYVSSLYITYDTARGILYSYGKYMSNPLAQIVDPKTIYLSILNGKRLDQPLTYVRNGKRSKPRASGAMSTVRQFNLLDIETIDIDAYHPTIWYLLREKKLVEYKYLFANAIALCEKWISNSILKQQKIQDE